MTHKTFKHNLKIYMQSVIRAESQGGFYVMSKRNMITGEQLAWNDAEQFIFSEARRKINKLKTRTCNH